MSDVIGKNDPSIDVPAVQQAVDAGGTVILRGTFSFLNVRLPGPGGSRVILVTGAVVIRGQDATIFGGGTASPVGVQAVFLIDAAGRNVTIEALGFVQPHNAAVRILRSGDLRIAGCRIDGVIPSPVSTPAGVQNAAIGIHLPGGSVGAVTITENQLQLGGTADDAVGGVIMTGPADSLTVTDNRIARTTSHGIDLRDIRSSARVERNVIETGSVGRSGLPGQFVDAVRLIGTGDYAVERNQFDCGFENAAVVRLGGTENAVVSENEIVASVPDGMHPGLQSAGVQVQGSARGNDIRANRIKGRARVAMSVVFSDFPLDRPVGTDGNPSATTLEANNVEHFAATVATVEIGPGARDTTINGGSGTLIDDGIGTVVHGNFNPPS